MCRNHLYLHLPAQPNADSIIEPFSIHFSWHSQTTTGAINSGFNSLKKSRKQTKLVYLNIINFKYYILYIPGGKISSVKRDAAVGIITFVCIFFCLPSIANVLVKPIRPIFAAL